MATEITDLIQIPHNKKVVIDFYATWCGPCARVTPIIDELAEKFENITFLKVNVDEADEIAAGFEISSLPTFVYLNLGNIVQRIEGANLADILTSIEKLDQIVNIQRTERTERIEPRTERIEPITENRPEKEIRKEKIKKPVIDSEMKPKKKPEPIVEMKIESKSKSKLSRDIEKKKSKKKSSKESQKKAERRNFNEMNPYEIEYNNDTPQVSSDSEYGSS
jgi:thioredoxin 1